MNTAATYHDLYEQLVAATGETPGSVLEEELAGLYERHPATFGAKVREVIAAWQAGRIRSAWAFLRAELRRVDEHRPTTEQAAPDLERQIHLAEQYIRNAGGYEPTEQSLLDALFGEHGRLRHHDTPQLRNRMIDLYRTERPRFEQAENAFIARGQRHRKAQQTDLEP